MPVLTIFAGPNGSAKSSLIRQVEFEGRQNLLEADAIARRIKPEAPQQAGVSAGKRVLRRTSEYTRNTESFAIETTLAGIWTSSAIGVALERSFFTLLFYICLDNPERSIQRYTRSLTNAGPVLRLVQQGLVFDNSGAEPRPVFEMRSERVVSLTNEIPEWAAGLLQTNTRLRE